MVSTTFFLNENYLTNLNAEKTDKKNPKKKSLWKFTKETFLKVKKSFSIKKILFSSKALCKKVTFESEKRNFEKRANDCQYYQCHFSVESISFLNVQAKKLHFVVHHSTCTLIRKIMSDDIKWEWERCISLREIKHTKNPRQERKKTLKIS